jgi:hypothetical protein
MSDGRELGWEDTIENDSPNFILLPEGEYDFEITKFERGRFTGSEKLPACNKATVTVHIETKDGETNIDHSLFLHTKTEGLLCQFFTSIGQRTHGEKLTMNWQKVPGSKGRCKIYIDKWTDKEGKPRENNKISKFLEPAAATQPTMFTPGSF